MNPAAGAPTSAPPQGTPEWDEWVKDYYRHVETYDWVTVTDGLKGPEALFHRNRERVVRPEIVRVWYSLLRFNVLFVARA